MNKEECEDLLNETNCLSIDTNKMVGVEIVSDKELRYNKSMNKEELLVEEIEFEKPFITTEMLAEHAESLGYDGGITLDADTYEGQKKQKRELFAKFNDESHIYAVVAGNTCTDVLGQGANSNRSSLLFPGCAPGHQKAFTRSALEGLYGAANIQIFILPMPGADKAERERVEAQLMLFTGMKKKSLNEDGSARLNKDGVEILDWVVPVPVKGLNMFNRVWNKNVSKLSGAWDYEALRHEFKNVYGAQGSEMGGWKHDVFNNYWVKREKGQEGLDAWAHDVKVLMSEFYSEFKLDK